MPNSSLFPPDVGLIVDRALNTIRLTRTLAVPPETAFAAWTRPEHVTCWWDPTGAPLMTCEIDLRPGGAFKFVTQNHSEVPFQGVYREISPPHLLTFSALGATGRVILQEEPHGTRLTVEIECTSSEHLEQFLKMGVADGTAQTLDNLAGYTSSL
jgi:uncharacterized protein YndB with AHSA1/START domain